MSTTEAETDQSKGWLLPIATVGWILLFSYLLLTSDPDVGPIKLRSFEDAGHFFGSLITGFLVFRVLRRWTSRSWLAALLSLLLTVSFLGVVEIAQELRPGRGYQRIDIQLNLAGAGAGVAISWMLLGLRSRLRRRTTS